MNIEHSVVEELKNRTEFISIGFDYTNPVHKEFIDKIQLKAKELGLWVAFSGEIEE